MPGSDNPQDAIAARDAAQERTAIARSQRGDVEAFNTLVERYQSTAYGLALRMVGNPDVAADVTQDAFFSAFRNIRSFRGMSFRSWLLRIVNNGCYDYWRSRRRRPGESLDALLYDESEAELTGDAELARALSDDSWNPEATALRAESIAAVESALQQLAPIHRLVIVLSDVHGLSYDEIARIADIPIGTVKSRIARGRSRLRELLLDQSELFSSAERQDIKEQ